VVGAMAMYQVHLAARFFSGLLLQLSKEFRDLGFLPGFAIQITDSTTMIEPLPLSFESLSSELVNPTQAKRA